MADEASPSSPTPETPPPRTTGGGFRWEPPTAEELQNLMPGYTIEKILGRGGMGAVYRGVQTNLDRPVAIKILPLGVEKEDPSFAERFKSEAKLMAKLNHPAVVAVYDFGTTLGGQLYFAMEYVDGSDVSQMIAAQGKLPPGHALAITAHVCDALHAAHELGIVHRDIKPANILINMKGQVKVADFGLAKVEEPGSHGLTKTGYAMGTPDFVSPEALTLGTAIDGRADIYAVGVMLYQMLTGNIPRGAWQPASVLVPGLDRRFDAIITKAMQYDREHRHRDAMELRRELDVILTVPLVQQDAPVMAAVPASQVAQAPGQRSAAQKPLGRPPQPRASAAAKKPEAAERLGREAAARRPGPPGKSLDAFAYIAIGLVAAVAIGAFVLFSGGKKDPGTTGPGAKDSVANVASTPPAAKTLVSKPPSSPPPAATAGAVGSSVLPRPDGKPADITKPVQVFILMGDGAMLGAGSVNPESTRGTLAYLTKKEKKYPHLLDDQGKWTKRDDVRSVRVVHFPEGSKDQVGWLTVSGPEIGTDLQIGHILGQALDAPVLLLKSCNGNRSLGWDLLPPGSERFTVNGTTYAGYKDTTDKWVESQPKKAAGFSWYAGKQYDMDVARAQEVLANIGDCYPGAKAYQIAGFLWWQGYRDQQDPVHEQRYEQNLVNLIKAVRKEFNAPDAPFVLATAGIRGFAPDSPWRRIAEAQLAVGDPRKHPEFAGRVKTVEVRDFWRGPNESPGGKDLEFHKNAGTFMDVGDALGRAMLELLKKSR